jgi:hypothetical protein
MKMKPLFIASFTMIFVTSCMPRPAYVAIAKHSIQRDTAGLTIQPVDFIYDIKKDTATCDIIILLNNRNDADIELDLAGSILRTSSDTLPIRKVQAMGKTLSNPLILPAKSDSLVGFKFTGQKNVFGDTLQLDVVAQSLHQTFYFRKSNKSDPRRPL